MKLLDVRLTLAIVTMFVLKLGQEELILVSKYCRCSAVGKVLAVDITIDMLMPLFIVCINYVTALFN